MIRLPKRSILDIRTILAQKGLDGSHESWQKRLKQISSRDVERALASPAGAGSYSLAKLVALVSPVPKIISKRWRNWHNSLRYKGL